MAVNPIIKQKADDIRHKIYGEEVRESLASGIEAISEDVEATIGRQDYVEEQFQNVIDNTTGKDVISAPEIIAARNGKPNLKTRIDDLENETTTQLEQTYTNKHPVINRILKKPTIMAHRGLYRVYPENTISAFNQCYKNGIEFFEVDFRKTIDGYWVCHHDASTVRLTGVDLDVASSTLSEIRALDITQGANSAMYGNPKIPTLDEVFAFIKHTNTVFNINFDYGLAPEDYPVIKQKIYDYNISNNVIVQSTWANYDDDLCKNAVLELNENDYEEAGKKGNIIAPKWFGDQHANFEGAKEHMRLGAKYNVPVNIYTVTQYSQFQEFDKIGVHIMMVDNLWFRTKGVEK